MPVYLCVCRLLKTRPCILTPPSPDLRELRLHIRIRIPLNRLPNNAVATNTLQPPRKVRPSVTSGIHEGRIRYNKTGFNGRGRPCQPNQCTSVRLVFARRPRGGEEEEGK